MERETPATCCTTIPVKNDKTHHECPVCSYNLCTIDPTPAKPVVQFSDDDILFVTTANVNTQNDRYGIIDPQVLVPVDTGPAIFIMDCVYRI